MSVLSNIQFNRLQTITQNLVTSNSLSYYGNSVLTLSGNNSLSTGELVLKSKNATDTSNSSNGVQIASWGGNVEVYTNTRLMFGATMTAFTSNILIGSLNGANASTPSITQCFALWNIVKSIITLSGNITGGSATSEVIIRSSSVSDVSSRIVLTGNNTFRAKFVHLYSGITIAGSNNCFGNSANILCFNANSATAGDLIINNNISINYPILLIATTTVFGVESSNIGIINIASLTSSTTNSRVIRKGSSGTLYLIGSNFNLSNTGATGTINVALGTLLIGVTTVTVNTVTLINNTGCRLGASTTNVDPTTTVTFTGSLDCNANNKIVVVCNNSSVSRMNFGATVNLGVGLQVDVSGVLNTGTYPIIVSTGTMGGPSPTIGSNSTGLTITFSQVGNTLNMIAV
jgi:hypothetical protein